MSIHAIDTGEHEWEVASPATTMFDFDYQDGREQLLRLYDKGTRRQWIGSDRIDWSGDLDPDNPLGIPDDIIPIVGTPWWEKMTPDDAGRCAGTWRPGSSASSCTASRARSSARQRSCRRSPTSTRSSTPPRR